MVISPTAGLGVAAEVVEADEAVEVVVVGEEDSYVVVGECAETVAGRLRCQVTIPLPGEKDPLPGQTRLVHGEMPLHHRAPLLLPTAAAPTWKQAR